MIEHFFQCPHCWEKISMLLDPSVAEQTYIEDCEICCNPISITTKFAGGSLQECRTTAIEQ